MLLINYLLIDPVISTEALCKLRNELSLVLCRWAAFTPHWLLTKAKPICLLFRYFAYRYPETTPSAYPTSASSRTGLRELLRTLSSVKICFLTALYTATPLNVQAVPAVRISMSRDPYNCKSRLRPQLRKSLKITASRSRFNLQLSTERWGK